MPVAARQGRMVLSRNSSILVTDAQLEILLREQMGFVFLPQHLDPRRTMTLILRWFDKLVALYEREQRPFAFFLGTRGKITSLPL
jgi:hypothetical protein